MNPKIVLSQREQDFVCKMQELYSEEAVLIQAHALEWELDEMEQKIFDAVSTFASSTHRNEVSAFTEPLAEADGKCWDAAQELIKAQDFMCRTQRKEATYNARRRELLKLAKKMVTQYALPNEKV